MGANKLKARRRQSRRKLREAERRGDDDALQRAQNTALARACAAGDETKMKNAMDCARATHAIERVAQEAEAKGVDVSGKKLNALADVLSACETGQGPADVQDETEKVDEEREKFEQHRVENGAVLRGKYAGKLGRKTVTVDGPLLLALRKKGVQDQAAYRERGYVPKDYDGTEEEHRVEFGKKQASQLAYMRGLRRLAREGIDSATLLPDVVPVYRVDLGQLFAVNSHLEPPPDEKRELYETPDEAFAVATRWRKYWKKERNAQRAAKAARGGVLNVHAHKTKDDLFCVKYSNKHKGKSCFVREPGTGGSWYYDWDAALDLKADYEKSNKDASWFVSATEVKAATKASQKASLMKGRASQKRKRET